MRVPAGAANAIRPCPPDASGIRSANWSMTCWAGVPLMRISLETLGGLSARIPATTAISASHTPMMCQGRAKA